MQKCSYCGTDLPENTRFCGQCGSVQDALATDAAATRRSTPLPQSWIPEGGTIPATPYSNNPAQGNVPAWSPNVQAPGTPPPLPIGENKDESRRDTPPWFPLYDMALGGEALMGSGQASTAGAPVVQGTPQIGSVPSVAGSPTPYTNPPVGHPALGAGNVPASSPVPTAGNASVGHPVQGPTSAPVSHPVQGPGNAPVSHPISHPVQGPVSHPVQGPGNTPISHPVQGPQPPEQPGTHEHHPLQGPHRHHAHPTQHEPHRHHNHTKQHEHHWEGGTKTAGGMTVKTILIVVAVVVVVTAIIGTLAVRAFNQLQKPILSSGPTANLTQAPTLVAPTPTATPAPTTPPAVLSSGTWQGQGTYNDGRAAFGMILVITVDGNSFSGTLREDEYSTTVNVTGTTTGDTISFTDTSYVSGNQITLGTTYSGTVSNGSISGTWVFPNLQDGSGTFSLSLTS